MNSRHGTSLLSLNFDNQALYAEILTLKTRIRELKAQKEKHGPYFDGEAKPPLEMLVFDETSEALYPNGIAAAQGFFKRPDSTPAAIAEVTSAISKRLRSLPQNPHQTYSVPAVFENFPEQSLEKLDTALSSLQSHLAHLTRPIDHLTFEVMERHRDWSYRDEHGNINKRLQGYNSIEDLADHVHEIYEERTTFLLAALNEYRGYLADFSHRVSDIRLNIQQKPAEAAPLFSLKDIKKIKEEQNLHRSLLGSVQQRGNGRNRVGGHNFNNGSNNNTNNDNSFSQNGHGGRGGSRRGIRRG
ncbi:MAG: hypothetical protein JOS17DRAFT_771108 [Linnemannia elongata]|nr:MAG: hypothetical protein JOS17DRAFT_771108 [Linnemannia elongata]